MLSSHFVMVVTCVLFRGKDKGSVGDPTFFTTCPKNNTSGSPYQVVVSLPQLYHLSPDLFRPRPYLCHHGHWPTSHLNRLPVFFCMIMHHLTQICMPLLNDSGLFKIVPMIFLSSVSKPHLLHQFCQLCTSPTK